MPTPWLDSVVNYRSDHSNLLVNRFFNFYMKCYSATSKRHQFHVAAVLDIPDLGSQHSPLQLNSSLTSIATMHLSSIISAALLVLANVANAAPTTEQLSGLFATSAVEARTTTLVRKEWYMALSVLYSTAC